MSLTSTSIAQDVRNELENLLDFVMNDKKEKQTAYHAERNIWKGVLSLGRSLMQLFFTVHSEREEQHKKIEVKGASLACFGQPDRQYVSLFGPVKLERYHYWAKGLAGVHPLDATLSIPKRIYSDCVQELLTAMEVWIPQDQTLDILTNWFDLTIPKKSLQASAADQSDYMMDYYAQRPPPETAEQDTILVVTADGKGIPMTRKDSPPPSARRGKGKNKTATKEAIITAGYTIAPYVRTSESIIQALLGGATDFKGPKPVSTRPKPSGKQTFGTLDGKAAALKHLAQVLKHRDTLTIAHRVALTDGSIALQRRTLEPFPEHTLILDIIHAVEYLWKAANALLGETNPDRLSWMNDALHCLLENDLNHLLNHLEYQRDAVGLPAGKRKTLNTVANYLRRNRSYMDYQQYLAKGYPIGTGVIEGACRHLVKDRFEQAGMRWSRKGAEEMLKLRAVYLNGDWEHFHQFRREQAHIKRYDTPHPAHAFEHSPEPFGLEIAA